MALFPGVPLLTVKCLKWQHCTFVPKIQNLDGAMSLLTVFERTSVWQFDEEIELKMNKTKHKISLLLQFLVKREKERLDQQ